MDNSYLDRIDCLTELHLHLDGSLPPDTVRRLAAINGTELPGDDAELSSLLESHGGDLGLYLRKFALPCSLLQTREALTLAAFELCTQLKNRGVIYAELRFAPQKHLERGLTQKEAAAAVVEGMRGSGLPSGLILCCMRGSDNEEENRDTVFAAAEYLGSGVCAVDLAGAEMLYKTENFAGLFGLVRSLEIPCTIHAGEADGADSVRAALALGAARIGHGVRSADDPDLVKELAHRGIALEMCPTSNLNTGIYRNLSEHPAAAMLRAGVPVTVSSDNMTVSATNIREEYRRLVSALGLTKAEVKTTLLNSASAAFADEGTKAAITKKINACKAFED